MAGHWSILKDVIADTWSVPAVLKKVHLAALVELSALKVTDNGRAEVTSKLGNEGLLHFPPND